MQLLLIANDTIPLKNKQELERADQTDNPNIEIFERSYADVTEFIRDRVSPFGQPSDAYIDRILEVCGGNLTAKASSSSPSIIRHLNQMRQGFVMIRISKHILNILDFWNSPRVIYRAFQRT